MNTINDSIGDINQYLRLIDLDKKLSISESRKLENVFYKRTHDIILALESLDLLKTMPKNKSRSNLMDEIESFLNPLEDKERIKSIDEMKATIETMKQRNNMLEESLWKLKCEYSVATGKNWSV